MDAIADILLISGAVGAGFYCLILARRLRKFGDLEKGVGGAVAVLSAQVDELNTTLELARNTANQSTQSLDGLTDRAENVSKRLELLVAAMHDLPETQCSDHGINAKIPDNPVFTRHAVRTTGSKQ